VFTPGVQTGVGSVRGVFGTVVGMMEDYMECLYEVLGVSREFG
jgi:hypothetical protein